MLTDGFKALIRGQIYHLTFDVSITYKRNKNKGKIKKIY